LKGPLRYSAKSVDYSAGFNIYRYENRNVSDFALHHGGVWLGFNSYLVRAQVQLNQESTTPQQWERISIVVLSNDAELSFENKVNPWTIAKDLAHIYWRSWGLPERYEVLQYLES
jgi:hypothetical protein